MLDPTLGDQLDSAAILAEPARRRLYEYIARRRREVGRDEAARAVGVDRPLAAFHLDKLAEAGFLDVSYRRLSGRSGPGAGRPSKLYRRSARQLELTVPSRRYDLVAALLAEAVESGGTPKTARALDTAARARGRGLGEEARLAAGSRAGREKLLRSAERLLAAQGFQPDREGGDIRLRNCPFDALASEHRDLVCGMNLDLMDGLVSGLRAKGVHAVFEPTEGACCVALRSAGK